MDRKLWWELGVVVGIIVVAVGFRFYDITGYPPGLFPDQAANGEDVLLIFDGDIRPFYERGNGREALFFYIQAVFVKAFGVKVWPMFVASAFVGTLTVLATYFSVRPFFGRAAAAFAALFLATSYWHVTLSRTGFRAIMIPLFIAAFTAFVGALITASKKKQIAQSYVYAALAGMAFAGGFYTYIAYRVMIGVLLGVLLLLLLAALHPKIGFPHFRRYGYQALVAVAAFLLTFAPIGWYFINHPETFVGRAGQVSVFNPDLQREYGGGTLMGTIWYSFHETARSLFIPPGDINWRHNVADYPFLNPLVGFLFLLGIVWTIQGAITVARRIIGGKEVHLGMIYPYVLLLLFGMLLPIITTAEGIPHGLRSVGLIIPIFMLAGTAGSVVTYWVWRNMRRMSQAVTLGVIAGVVILAGIYDGMLYFVVARNDSAAAYAYRADLTTVAEFINEYAAKHGQEVPRPYLVLDEFSLQTVHYLTTVAAHEHVVGRQVHPDEAQHKWVQLTPEHSHLTLLEPGGIIIFTQSTMPDADRYAKTYGAAIDLVESTRNRFDQEVMRIYRAHSSTPAGDEFDLDAG